MSPKIKNNKVLRALISPAFQMVVWIRNRLYDLEVLRSHRTPLMTVSVGNITVGGTGKTPHSEYLIRLLGSRYQMGYLSRGYRRRTRGLQVASASSTSRQIGDEAMQVHRKFADLTVVVDGNRMNALSHMSKRTPCPEVVILDDCYQHRRIQPDVNILLIDYNRPIYHDKLLPFGELRESASNTDRADIIIVTKCPDDMRGVDVFVFRSQLSPLPYQSLFFSHMVYDTPRAAFAGGEVALSLDGCDVLVVSGVAQPKYIADHLRQFTRNIHTMDFPDHHHFSAKDMAEVERRFLALDAGHRAVVMTEKDVVRLDVADLSEHIRPHIYVLPMRVEIMFGDGKKFDQTIEKLVAKKLKERKK